MLDTVNFLITRDDVEGVDFIRDTLPLFNLDKVFDHRKRNGLSVDATYLDNLFVEFEPWRLTVKGSLCKWYLGDNYQSMRRADIKQAVERLSEILQLPMERAKITRLDVGLSIPVKEPPVIYFNHLGALAYAQRVMQPHGVNYFRHSNAETLIFYDKNREQRDKGFTIPDLYINCHMLRYEQQYKKRLSKLLNVPKVTGAMLYDEEFYISLLTRWREAYQAITKVNDITLNFPAMTTKRKLNTMGVLALVERMGGENNMLTHITEAQKRGELTAKQAFDLRQAVKHACKSPDDLTKPVEAMAELDKKITEAVRFYR